jgi:hypothetical protein
MNDQQVLTEKNRSFAKWGTALLSRARKVLTRDRASMAYFGSEALNLREAGMEMTQL